MESGLNPSKSVAPMGTLVVLLIYVTVVAAAPRNVLIYLTDDEGSGMVQTILNAAQITGVNGTALNMPSVAKKPIPHGYEDFGVAYYKYHKDGLVWGRALQVCQNEGGHLAIINSPQEADILYALMARYPATALPEIVHKDFVLIGFHDFFVNADYVTVKGDSLLSSGYIHWAKGEPGNADQNCGALHRTGLADFPCNVASPFICELEI